MGVFMITAVVTYLIVVAVMSAISFVAYGLDKRWAANGGRRVPERTLHLLAVLGGWPGAMLAQRQFRHKTRKIAFRVVFWSLVALHVAVVGAAATLHVNSSTQEFPASLKTKKHGTP
jgi:uncharacterized membrane protein YsdA (DUF1294 family)